jgi:hypothetical protein
MFIYIRHIPRSRHWVIYIYIRSFYVIIDNISLYRSPQDLFNITMDCLTNVEKKVDAAFGKE